MKRNRKTIRQLVNFGTDSPIKKLKSVFKTEDYSKYVDKLSEAIQDDKVKELLNFIINEELDKMITVSSRDIPATDLIPTQNEIDVDKSLKWLIKNGDSITTIYTNANKGVKLGPLPVVTFNSKYIIDGHHRWSQIYCGNPDAKVSCYDMKANMTPIEVLKLMQMYIAASVGEVPIAKVDGKNLLTIDDKYLFGYIKNNIQEACKPAFKKYCNCDTTMDIIDFINDNRIRMQETSQPIKNAPKRDVMPQTDRAPEVSESLDKGELGYVVPLSNIL